MERFFALGFAMEQLRQNFVDLEMRVAEWVKASAAGKASSAG